MSSTLSNFPLLALAIGLGFILGLLFHYFSTKNKMKRFKVIIEAQNLREQQLASDHDILLQAMEGAKAQAEDMQRKLYGTNVIEITEPQDATTLLNRQKLAQFVQKKLETSSSRSDDQENMAQPGNPKILESLKALDAEVINILSEAIEN